jgi:uncharacterized protein (TIRG00374 family)
MTSIGGHALSRPERRSLLVGVVVGLPLSAVFLYLAVRSVDFDNVRTALGDAEPSMVALAVVGMAGVYLFQSRRWQLIASAPAVAYPGFVEMVISAVACNNVLPGRLGDLFRARWLGVRGGIPGGRALSTVVFDRGADLAVLIVFLATSVWLVDTREWIRGIAQGSLAIAAMLVAVLVFSRVYTRHRARERLSQRGLARRVVRDTLEGLARSISLRGGLIVLLLSTAAWLSYAAGAWAVAAALDIDVSPSELVFLTAVVNLGIAIPSSPGFIGTYQWLAVSTLSLYGVDRDAGLAFGILLHAVWFVPTTVVGGAMLVWRGLHDLRRRARAQVEAEMRRDARSSSNPL